MFENFKYNMKIILRTWSGRVGVTLLLIQIFLAAFAIAAYYPDKMKQFEIEKGTYYPYFYPNNVPPCWSVKKKFKPISLSKDDMVKSKVVIDHIPPDLKTVNPDLYKLLSSQLDPLIQAGYYKVIYINYTGYINIKTDALPNSIRLLITVNNIENISSRDLLASSLYFYIIRPDGLPETIIYTGQLYASQTGSLAPTKTSNRTSEKIILIYGTKLVTDHRVMYVPDDLANYRNTPFSNILQNTLVNLYKYYLKLNNLTNITLPKTLDTRILFGKLEGKRLVGLPGRYEVHLGLYAIVNSTKLQDYNKSINIDKFELKLFGNCYGFFGTDVYSRPLSKGLLFGLPYAFLIGFIVTFISTFIGAIYGTLAGYWKDVKGEALMRVADVMLSLPFLPILIAISYSYGAITLNKLMLLMIALSWAGPVIVVRSMALQISEQLYIEAAKATGVSTKKIIFKYIFPQIYPYTMAIAVLSIPGVIIAEASLALLGFGDPTAPTWGKMLQLAYNVRAVTAGWWWLYIFPGLALVVFSATFLLLGRALEPIVAPKLQK